MLRIYCLQQWFALSDPAMEESLYDIESMRRFVGVELKASYFQQAVKNLASAHTKTQDMFSQAEAA